MNDQATIYYHDIGDYLTREQKLARVKAFGSVATCSAPAPSPSSSPTNTATGFLTVTKALKK